MARLQWDRNQILFIISSLFQLALQMKRNQILWKCKVWFLPWDCTPSFAMRGPLLLLHTSMYSSLSSLSSSSSVLSWSALSCCTAWLSSFSSSAVMLTSASPSAAAATSGSRGGVREGERTGAVSTMTSEAGLGCWTASFCFFCSCVLFNMQLRWV